MASTELKTLLGPPSSKSPSSTNCVRILALLREARLPRPNVILELGETALKRLSENTREHWEVAAQICSAAAELREFEIMDSMLEKIMKRFPHSPRSFVLLGRVHESRGKMNEAMETYMSVIDKQPMAPAMYKRQVALLKSEMEITEAVAMLNYYLDFYCEDVDAWAELCALCLQLGRLSHALFAACELVVHDPRNHAYQTLAADVYMTCGGMENVLKAREHYAASLMSRKHGNLRALYGLYLACSTLRDNKLLEVQVEKNEKLLAVSQAGIRAVYDKLRKTSSSKTVGKSALAVLEIDITTGTSRTNTSS